MPLIKSKEIGGMIAGKKEYLPHSSRYVRLSNSSNSLFQTKEDDEDHNHQGCRSPILGNVNVPMINVTTKKKDIKRARSYGKLSSNNNNNGDEEQQEGTPKGHVPVMVGKEEGDLKRFVVPTRFMKDPSIVTLLKLSAEEFGYDHQGVLQIPCDPQCFEKILDKISKKR